MTLAPVLLVHVYGDDPDLLHGALRVARNARAALPTATVQLVVQSGVVRATVHGTGTDAEIEQAADDGVRVLACENSLARVDVDIARLHPRVGTVPSAVAYLAEQQWAGAAYVRV